jgi:hypothetical protein
MCKFVNYSLLLLIILFFNSCKINVSGSDDDGEGGNNSSIILSNPNPSNGALEVPLTPVLSWYVQNNNTFVIRYDVYLGTSYPPTDSIGASNVPSFMIFTPLEGNQKYYWKIRAIGDNGGDTISDIWSFTTTSGGFPIDGLVAYYPFNGNAIDESGYGNHGQNYGATLIPDRFNQSNKAYYFNGVNSYIVVPHTQSLQPSNGLTISAWINFNSFNCTSSILGKGSDNAAGWYSFRYEPSTSSLDFQINFSDYIGGPKKTISVYTAMNVNMWYNIIGMYDGNIMKIYFNGQLYSSLPVYKLLGSNSENLQIGSCTEGYFLKGNLDDIRIYNRALTDTEVQLLFHEGGWQ